MPLEDAGTGAGRRQEPSLSMDIEAYLFFAYTVPSTDILKRFPIFRRCSDGPL